MEPLKKPVHMTSKKITKVSPMMHGHLHVEFEDGSQSVLHRGDHEEHELKAGDYYQPLKVDSEGEASNG